MVLLVYIFLPNELLQGCLIARIQVKCFAIVALLCPCEQLEGAPSQEELYAMVGDPRYKTDAAYRQRVERMFGQYAK